MPVVLLLGNNNSESQGQMTLGEAFCSDLRAGYSPLQILGGDVRSGRRSPSEAADLAYGWAAIDCPEQLRSNASLRTYLENWDINPDA